MSEEEQDSGSKKIVKAEIIRMAEFLSTGKTSKMEYSDLRQGKAKGRVL